MRQLKVIGVGLPRTATLSQKIALEMLGFAPCYHMVEVLRNLDLVDQWANAAAGKPNWDEIFGDCQATVDWPGGYFYKELIEEYPQAKVILSVRDGDAWAQSMNMTIWNVLNGDSMMHDLSSARGRIDPGWHRYLALMGSMWKQGGFFDAADTSIDLDGLARAMERYNQQVTEIVPSDRLLRWSPADGWDPLCEFLGVPTPQAPLPRVNDAERFSGMIVDGCMAALTEWRAQQPSV